MGLFSKKKESTREPETTDKLPVVPFRVLKTGIPFFEDPEGTKKVEGAELVYIQALDPSDDIQEIDIVPTTQIYEPGQFVTLDLDNKTVWYNCYFKDPEDGEIAKAWNVHVNFIGKLIDDEVVAENRDHLDELVEKVEAKIEEISQRQQELEEPEEPVH